MLHAQSTCCRRHLRSPPPRRVKCHSSGLRFSRLLSRSSAASSPRREAVNPVLGSPKIHRVAHRAHLTRRREIRRRRRAGLPPFDTRPRSCASSRRRRPASALSSRESRSRIFRRRSGRTDFRLMMSRAVPNRDATRERRCYFRDYMRGNSRSFISSIVKSGISEYKRE